MPDKSSWLEWFNRVRGAEGYIVLTVCVGLVSDTFIYGVIVPIVPTTLTQRSGVDPKDVQKWISALLAAFGAALMVGSPILGYVCDRLRTYRNPFLLGLIAVTASTVLFMIGTSPALLVIARALQGLSSAVLGVVGLAFMADSVDESRIGNAMGYASLALTWGLLLGPVLGGIIFERAGYLAVFIIPIVFIVVDFFLRLTCKEKSSNVQKAPSDSSGSGDDQTERQALLGSQRSAQGPHDQRSSQSAEISGDGAEAGDSSEASNTNQSHGVKPGTSVAWRLVTSPRMMTAVVLLFVNGLVFTSFESTLPLYVQDQYHWTSSRAGAMFLALCGPSLFGSLFGRLTDRVGSRVPALIGITVTGVTLLLFHFVIYEASETSSAGQQTASVPSSQPYILVVLLVLIGFGDMAFQVVGMAETSRAIGDLTPATNDDNKSEQNEQSVGMGQAYALTNIGYAGGQFIGPIFGGFVRERVGFPTMNTIMGAIVLCTLVPTAFFIGQSPARTGRDQNAR